MGDKKTAPNEKGREETISVVGQTTVKITKDGIYLSAQKDTA